MTPACCKYLFGPYSIVAVKHYFDKNNYIAIERDAYVVYCAHFN